MSAEATGQPARACVTHLHERCVHAGHEALHGVLQLPVLSEHRRQVRVAKEGIHRALHPRPGREAQPVGQQCRLQQSSSVSPRAGGEGFSVCQQTTPGAAVGHHSSPRPGRRARLRCKDAPWCRAPRETCATTPSAARGPAGWVAVVVLLLGAPCLQRRRGLLPSWRRSPQQQTTRTLREVCCGRGGCCCWVGGSPPAWDLYPHASA
jgi:hypothetical protein